MNYVLKCFILAHIPCYGFMVHYFGLQMHWLLGWELANLIWFVVLYAWFKGEK